MYFRGDVMNLGCDAMSGQYLSGSKGWDPRKSEKDISPARQQVTLPYPSSEALRSCCNCERFAVLLGEVSLI